jgi:WD40 repeat protein
MRNKLLSMDVAGEVQILNVDVTEIAHDKDINSVSVSPNDRLIATGSQDKTAKVSFVPIVTNFMEQISLEKHSYWADQLLSKGSLTCSQKPPLLYPALRQCISLWFMHRITLNGS